MSTQAERHTASIKEFNSLLMGEIDPALSPEQKHARRNLIQETRAEFFGDEREPAPNLPPKVCPMSRSKLRKVIKAGLENVFDETFIPYRELANSIHAGNAMIARNVAVGCAELYFDESDPVFLTGSMRYEHGEATREQSEAILDRMASVLVSDYMGPAKGFIEPIGAQSYFAGPEKLFKVEFKVRCPA